VRCQSALPAGCHTKSLKATGTVYLLVAAVMAHLNEGSSFFVGNRPMPLQRRPYASSHRCTELTPGARRDAQNSWSTYWGDKGYVKVAREHGCGITTSAMYAIMGRHEREVNASSAAAPAAADPAPV